MSAGHIRRRGAASWELKYEVGRDPLTGRRLTKTKNVKGTKRDAQLKLAQLITAVGTGAYIEPTKITVAEHVRARVEQWESAGDITARTAQRYRQLVENQIAPHLGELLLPKLRRSDIEAWHSALRVGGRKRGAGGMSPRTIGHAHRVLAKALSDAAKDDLLTRNVAKVTTPPRVTDAEMRILSAEEVGSFAQKLDSSELQPLAVAALFTGMRLGELLALRWSHIDLIKGVVSVREALEETKAYGIRVKPPKTKRGRRDISLPEVVARALRDHRRRQLELRMQLGLGRLPDEALVFPTIEGDPQSPSAVSRQWGTTAAGIGLADVTFHALRHTHASQLIDAGVDVVTISRRLGHANPTITLSVYAHRFRDDDSKAAAAINALTGLAGT